MIKDNGKSWRMKNKYKSSVFGWEE